MKVSLALKWVVASLLIESFMLSLMVMKNVNQLEDDLITQTKIRLNEQKILLQSALAAPLVQMDYATINSILKETKALPNIDYLIVVDNKNNCIASLEWSDCKNLPLIETDPFSKESLEDKRYDTSIPIAISYQKLGVVYLGLSTKFYIDAKKDMITRSVLIAIIELILSAILLITISKWITKNLVRLTNMANEISRGNYSQRVSLSDSSEETSRLETSLNIMAMSIEKNIKDLEISYTEQKKLSEELKHQLAKNHEQDLLLEHQSRMAALGEMLTNIAHQWRQPLNAISVLSSSLKLKNDYQLLKENDINDTTEKVINYAKYLSDTIDDFRNFIKNDSVKENFSIQKCFNQASDIVALNLSNQEIKIEVLESEEIFINGITNELAQVFINILNNAKDVLLEKEIDSKFIQVKFYKEDKKIYITIQDNAGGVDETIKDKVFDPYFTTKHQSQGTGIGLYMCSRIIHEHFNGEIFVENEDIIYENNRYKGAKFYIVIKDN